MRIQNAFYTFLLTFSNLKLFINDLVCQRCLKIFVSSFPLEEGPKWFLSVHSSIQLIRSENSAGQPCSKPFFV